MIHRIGFFQASGRMLGAVLLAGLLSGFSSLAAAESGQRYLVGVEGIEFMPYSSLTSTSNYQGFHRELLDLFAQDQDITFDYIPLPYIRNAHLFLAGQLDFQFPDDPAWIPHLKTDGQIFYSEPAVSYVDGIMLMAVEQGAGIDRLKRLGILNGWTPSAYYERQEQGLLELVEHASLSSLVHALLQGEIDGIYTNQRVMERYLRQRNLQTVIVADNTLPYRKSGFSLASIRHPHLIEAFDQFLLMHKVEVEALKERYQMQ